MSATLHIGLIVNPLAGLGGSLALKGSDGEELRELAATLLPEQRRSLISRPLTHTSWKGLVDRYWRW